VQNGILVLSGLTAINMGFRTSIRTENRPVSICFYHLVTVPRAKSVDGLRVVSDNVDSIGPVMVVNKTIDLLLEQNTRAPEKPADLVVAQSVHCEANSVPTTGACDLSSVLLCEHPECRGRVFRQQGTPSDERKQSYGRQSDYRALINYRAEALSGGTSRGVLVHIRTRQQLRGSTSAEQ
jgi:hypothetical protein